MHGSRGRSGESHTPPLGKFFIKFTCIQDCTIPENRPRTPSGMRKQICPSTTRLSGSAQLNVFVGWYDKTIKYLNMI